MEACLQVPRLWSVILLCDVRIQGMHYGVRPFDSCLNLLSALDFRNAPIGMHTVLVITFYNIVWCIRGHMRCMQHTFLFPKVASLSQYASLLRDVRHARVRWLCWQFSGHFRPAIRSGALPRGSLDVYEMLPIYSSSIWPKICDPPRRVPATIWRNPRQQNQSPAYCSDSGPRPGHSPSKCGWRYENDFIVMGNVH